MEALIDIVAADMLRAIIGRADWNRQELGGLIFERSNGSLGYTAFLPSSDFRTTLNAAALPKNNIGQPDWRTVRGMAHSHPQFPDTANPSQAYDAGTDRLMRPSQPYLGPGGVMIGDYLTADGVISNITSQGGASGSFPMYIFGYNPNTGTLSINKYYMGDRNSDTTQRPVNLNPLPLCKVLQ